MSKTKLTMKIIFNYILPLTCAGVFIANTDFNNWANISFIVLCLTAFDALYRVDEDFE